MWCNKTYLLRFRQLKVQQNLTQKSWTTYEHLLVLHFILPQWIRLSAQDPLISISTHQNLRPYDNPQNMITNPRNTPLGISKLPDALCTSYMMSQLPSQPWTKISECYHKLLADPTLIWSFPIDEWMSVEEHLCLGILHFQVVLEGLFTRLISPVVRGQARVKFITSSGKRAMSKEIIRMAVLITDGVGKGSLGLVTAFYHSNQAKVEPLVMLMTLTHCDSHELALVVMRIFTNLSYFQWGSFGLLFLDVATLWEGASMASFSLSQLCLYQLLLYSPTQVLLPREGVKAGELKAIPITMMALWDSSIEDHHLSPPVSLSVSKTSPYSCRDRGLHTKEGLVFTVALGQLQVAAWVRLHHEQHNQSTLDDELATELQERRDRMKCQYQGDATKWREELTARQEDLVSSQPQGGSGSGITSRFGEPAHLVPLNHW